MTWEGTRRRTECGRRAARAELSIVVATCSRVEEVDLLDDEAVVAAGGLLLHNLATPVLGEIAGVAQPGGPPTTAGQEERVVRQLE